LLISLRVPCRGEVAFVQVIKPDRVIAQHFLLKFVGQIFARFEMGQVAAELVALTFVREVRGPEDNWDGGTRALTVA